MKACLKKEIRNMKKLQTKLLDCYYIIWFINRKTTKQLLNKDIISLKIQYKKESDHILWFIKKIEQTVNDLEYYNP